MAKNVFFSWQDDIPTKVGHSFLKEALREACENISADTSIDEAMRDLKVDSDTKGVAGQPPIVETILKKIDASSVFVADMTFVGTRIDGKRLTPNPNVLIEYGWALKSLTHERVICVMNTAYGEPAETNLPFNLKHVRWPITYNLPENATKEIRASEKKRLVSILEKAIRASLTTIPTPLPEKPKEFPEAKVKEPPARFRDRGKEIGIKDDSGWSEEKNKEIFLADGPCMWLRIMPAKDLGQKWSTHKLKDFALKFQPGFLPLSRHSPGYSYLRAEDGIGMYGALNSPLNSGNRYHIYSLAFIFETGEVWSIEVDSIIGGRDQIYYSDIESSYTRALVNYTNFLKTLGIDGPYKWKAGITGVKNKKLAYPPPPGKAWVGSGPTCTTDLIEVEGQYDGQESSTSALLPFFEKIFDKCGRPYPDYLPK